MKTKEENIEVHNKVITIDNCAIAAVVLDAVAGQKTDFSANLGAMFREYAEQNPGKPSVAFAMAIADNVCAYFQHAALNAEQIQ